MNPFDPALFDADAASLDARVGGEDPAWDLLVGLRAAALHRAAASDVPDLPRLAAWAAGAEDDAVLASADRSLLMAELLEGSIELAPAAEGPRRLVASTAVEAAPEPFPAVYTRGAWTVVVGLDEVDRLFVAVDRAPSGDEATLVLPDVDRVLHVRPGEVLTLGAAVELLGAEPSFNPVRTLRVRQGDGPWATVTRVSEA
jgi:hypothetical protein